jgi:hypothetical protein
MTRHRRRAALFTLLLMTGIIICAGLWLRAQRRQAALNRQLIAALVKHDTQQALTLVYDGADPNTPLKPRPVPSLRAWWNFLLHRSSLSVNNSPTALLIVCGADFTETHTDVDFSDASQLARAMLEHGASLKAQDENGWTPLRCAVRDNYRRTVSVLLEYGADVNVKDVIGWTPFLQAAQLAPDLMPLLFEHGGDVNTQNNDGDTPLQFVTANGYADHVRFLLEHGADVNAKNRTGETALYWAVGNSDTPDDAYTAKILPQLLLHGANPNLPSNNNTILQLAKSKNRPDLVALLRRYGAKK